MNGIATGNEPARPGSCSECHLLATRTTSIACYLETITPDGVPL